MTAQVLRATGYLSVTAIAVVSAACGITAQQSARIVPSRDVPFALMQTTTTSKPPASPPGQALLQVFLVSSTHLTAVDRLEPSPVDISTALAQLLAGPSSTESFEGVGTDIPAGTTIRSLGTTGGVATLDLSDTFASVAGQSQILAIAQVVYTVTELPGITQVEFELGGAATEVPSADGTLLDRPVDRADYATLLGPAAGGELP